MRDRFVVRSTTGFHINPATGSYPSGKRTPPTSFYVLDTAFAWRTVWVIDGQSTGNRFKRIRDADREALAEAKAKELNEWAETA
jgi:hypothetical protein